jgi:hypothetical protein
MRADSQATDQEAPTATLATVAATLGVTSVEGRQGCPEQASANRDALVGTQVLRSGAVDLG